MSVLSESHVEAKILLSWTMPGRAVGFIPYSWFLKDETALLNPPNETLFFQTFGFEPEARANYVHKPPPPGLKGDWFSWDYDRRLRLTHIYSPSGGPQRPMTWDELAKIVPFDDEVLAADEAHEPARTPKPSNGSEITIQKVEINLTSQEKLWEQAQLNMEAMQAAAVAPVAPVEPTVAAQTQPQEIQARQWPVRWHSSQPCPFCGDGRATLISSAWPDGTLAAWVECGYYHARGPVTKLLVATSRIHPDDDCPHKDDGKQCPAYQAWEAWNARTPGAVDVGAPCSPCPFCGHPVTWIENLGLEWRMYCCKCFAVAPPGIKAEPGATQPSANDRISAVCRWELRFSPAARNARPTQTKEG